jgi:hypothetical protein
MNNHGIENSSVITGILIHINVSSPLSNHDEAAL